MNKGLQLRINYHVEHGLGDVVTVQFVKHLAQVKIPNRRADVVDPVRFRRVVDLPQQQHITYTRCPIEEKRAVSGSSPIKKASNTHTHTHPFKGPMSWTTQVSRYQKGRPKPIWILLKQETVSGSGISWAVCKSAPRSRQITTPAPHRSVFLQAGCRSCRPTNSVKALKAKKQVSK